ncbi:MAG: hypothetical protein MRT15_11270 [archaeon YNP-LCB-003-016]|jgi:hypothetical protein|nr:hypothetical protein [Candidatus Culexarchaeum yellowstonense]
MEKLVRISVYIVEANLAITVTKTPIKDKMYDEKAGYFLQYSKTSKTPATTVSEAKTQKDKSTTSHQTGEPSSKTELA